MARVKGKLFEMELPDITPLEELVSVEKEVEDTATTAISNTLAQETAASNPGSLKRSFLDNLQTMFTKSTATEAVIGSVIASAFGGSEAGAEAFKIGRELGSERVKNDMTREALNLKRTQQSLDDSSFQTYGYLVDKDGNQVKVHKRTGKYYVGDKEIPVSQVLNMNISEHQRKLEQGNKRIGQANERIAQSKEVFVDRQDEDKTRKMEKPIKSYESDATVKQVNEALLRAEGARVALENDSVFALPATSRALARLSGEVGVLTDADVAVWQGSQAVLDRFSRWMKNAAKGTMTQEDKKNAKEMLDVYTKVAENRKRQKAVEIAKRYASTTSDYSEQQMTDILLGNNPSGKPTSVNEVIRYVPSQKRNAVFNADTKEFIRWE